jgi:hypothetical protein
VEQEEEEEEEEGPDLLHVLQPRRLLTQRWCAVTGVTANRHRPPVL